MNQEHFDHFSSDLPYPPVCADELNCLYAREMLSNIGGSNSEMSAVSLYFYNNLITAEYPEVSMIFHKISIVEMHHMEIFGTLARQLGENPRLWAARGNRKIYWTPAYNKYPMHIHDLLCNALEGEEAAIAKYRRQLKCICNENIQENLKRIIVDEELHVSIFKELLQEY